MVEERAVHIGDYVIAELVECQPEEAARAAVPLPQQPETSQEQQKADATIEQTGADPPPARLQHLLQHRSGRDGSWFATTSQLWSLIPPIVGWQLWYADCSVVSSGDCTWANAPCEGVQVLMVHHAGRQMAGGRESLRTIVKGRDAYVLPGERSVKYGLMIEPGAFHAVVRQAMADAWRPG